MLTLTLRLTSGMGLVGPKAGMGATNPAGAVRGAMVSDVVMPTKIAKARRLKEDLMNKIMAS